MSEDSYSPHELPSAAPGIRWGPFTARIPFVHTRAAWPELVQNLVVAGAPGLAPPDPPAAPPPPSFFFAPITLQLRLRHCT